MSLAKYEGLSVYPDIAESGRTAGTAKHEHAAFGFDDSFSFVQGGIRLKVAKLDAIASLKGSALEVFWPHQNPLEDRSTWKQAQDIHDKPSGVIEAQLALLCAGCPH